MPAFFIYLRNITYYLMFAAVVSMLAPPGKYKKFVSLVMGFILLNVMLSPLARFSAPAPVTDWFHGLATTHGLSEDPETSYARWRNAYLHTAFEAQLVMQLEGLLSQNGFIVHESRVTFLDDFTALTGVYVTLSRQESRSETLGRPPLIRIQPPEFGRGQQPEPCAVTVEAQNLISQFYHLPTAHIYVAVR